MIFNEIILIVGLPGSGKTYLANQLNKNKEYIVVDDITSISQLPQKGNIIICDVNFCDDRILKIAIDKLFSMYPKHNIRCIYFENNSKVASQNVKNRNDGRNVKGTIRRFEKIYNPPKDVLKIFETGKNNV